jgi:hypothetical protein
MGLNILNTFKESISQWIFNIEGELKSPNRKKNQSTGIYTVLMECSALGWKSKRKEDM